MDEFSVAEVFIQSLNGGAPVDDWCETKEWAENICRPRGDELAK